MSNFLHLNRGALSEKRLAVINNLLKLNLTHSAPSTLKVFLFYVTTGCPQARVRSRGDENSKEICRLMTVVGISLPLMYCDIQYVNIFEGQRQCCV